MKISLLLFCLLLGSSCSNYKWYKGNTHVHTILCGHADSSPEVVTQWYHDHDYNFLVLSEHNKFIDPDKVKMPANKREDFILIPGEEVTGKRHVHTTALNVKKLVPWDFTDKQRSNIIQRHVDDIHAAGGIAILNHPNWRSAVTPDDIKPVKGLYMFELFNNKWEESDFSEHHDLHPSEEVLWDRLLSSGMLMYGVGSDDAHKFKEFDFKASNPGRGWVMVRAEKLTPEHISQAMWNGQFYTSTGVYIKEHRINQKKLTVRVDVDQTLKELSKDIVRQGKKVPGQQAGFTIELIGYKGKLLKTVKGSKAEFKLNHNSPYYRVKVTYTQHHPTQGHEAYFAWYQPIFMDGRVEKLRAASQHQH
jgi:hypothetical protein